MNIRTPGITVLIPVEEDKKQVGPVGKAQRYLGLLDTRIMACFCNCRVTFSLPCCSANIPMECIIMEIFTGGNRESPISYPFLVYVNNFGVVCGNQIGPALAQPC